MSAVAEIEMTINPMARANCSASAASSAANAAVAAGEYYEPVDVAEFGLHAGPSPYSAPAEVGVVSYMGPSKEPATYSEPRNTAMVYSAPVAAAAAPAASAETATYTNVVADTPPPLVAAESTVRYHPGKQTGRRRGAGARDAAAAAAPRAGVPVYENVSNA